MPSRMGPNIVELWQCFAIGNLGVADPTALVTNAGVQLVFDSIYSLLEKVMKRAIRIGNCSGAHMDAGYHMLRQATAGEIDAITGDYLAEMNIANNAEAMRNGAHPGYEATALDGLLLSLNAIAEKKLKVVVNGGALNPKGLAEKVAESIRENNLEIRIAWVEGDDLMARCNELLHPESSLAHLDGENADVVVHKSLNSYINNPKKPIVSANAYLGARGIFKALEMGADIVICGRVADASPVIGLAQWWHGWSLEDYDPLAGALLAGHLIECSGYVTGSNYCGFTRHPLETFIDIGYGIAEIKSNGDCVITKHDKLNGLVNEDTVRTQLLYELQGNVYLNSDVKADLANVMVKQVGNNRVHVSGAKGYPPPPTTKFAIFYRGGFQNEIWIGLTGTSAEVERKKDLMEAQTRFAFKKANLQNKLQELEFQLYGRPQSNAVDEFAGTAMLRIFTQAETFDDVRLITRCIGEYAIGMQHVSGMHVGDVRTAVPKPFLVYYPALIPQSTIKELAHLLPSNRGGDAASALAQPITRFGRLEPRVNSDSRETTDLTSFGPTQLTDLGSVVWARSGDKGGNLNIGFFVHEEDEYSWLKAFLSKERLQVLLAGSWKDEYHIERCEFPKLYAVHFVVYGILGRGVSSSTILDSLGKGFADFLRAKLVEMPEKFIARYSEVGTPDLETSKTRSWPTVNRSSTFIDKIVSKL